MEKERTEKEHSMLIFSHLLVGVRMVSFRLKEFAPIHPRPRTSFKINNRSSTEQKAFSTKTHARSINLKTNCWDSRMKKVNTAKNATSNLHHRYQG